MHVIAVKQGLSHEQEALTYSTSLAFPYSIAENAEDTY